MPDFSARQNRWLSNPYVWSFTTYFAEGFPYTIIRAVSTVFFRDRGMSLEAIGLTSLFGLPWILKFLWGPQVDQFGTKRLWLLIMQGALAVVFLLAALILPFSWAITALALLFFMGSFIAATHDIAIDGYYMEALDKLGQAKFLGYRVMAYRIAMMTGTGIIVTIGTTIGWPYAFFAAAAVMALLFGHHFLFLPRCETPILSLRDLPRTVCNIQFIFSTSIVVLSVLLLRAAISSDFYLTLQATSPFLEKLSFPAWIGLLLFLALIALGVFRNTIRQWIMKAPDSFYSQAFLTFMDREKAGTIIAFIILIRTGEFMLTSMTAPFMVDLGIKVHYGWISGGVGLPCSIVGAMAGGWLIAKYTLQKMALPFLLAQNVTNVVYMLLALSLSGFLAINTGNEVPSPLGTTNMLIVVAVHGFDQFAGGLGTAVLMTFLMRICRPQFKAAHYAIGTGLMSVSGLYAGIASGFLASWLGYGLFFGISFLMSIPGMVLIPFVPLEDSENPR
jgi:PAT family beta-lactamase induction signal transducer AmpG